MQGNSVYDLYCSSCGNQIARLNDFNHHRIQSPAVCPLAFSVIFLDAKHRTTYYDHFLVQPQDRDLGGYFYNMRNVNIGEQPNTHEHGYTQVVRFDTCCMQCNELLGWQIAEESQLHQYFVPGRFFVIMDQLMFQNHVTLRQYLFGGANLGAPNNQVGGVNTDQDGGANNQVGGGADGQAPNEQNADDVGGANVDQVGGANAQAPNEQNADQVGGANADQDGGANAQAPNEQNADQVVPANAEHDGGANNQDGGADAQDPNEQNADQVVPANAEHDGGANNQDGGADAQALLDEPGYIVCCICGNQVAFIEDYVPNAQDAIYGGYINRMFDVIVENNENHHSVVDGDTLAIISCMTCLVVIAWELIAVAQPSEYFVVGRYFVRLHLLRYQNGETLHEFLFGDVNVQDPNDQVGGANAQAPNEQNADQVVPSNAEHDGGANNQVGGANAQAPNEQNADQVVPDNAVQDGGANNQVGGANEQAPNEHNADQVVNEQVPNEQDGGANDQVGGANDQDGGVNEQDPNEDGGAPMKRMKM
ncbi:hypothetical protein FXO37_32563 [Capsicum annuum]|nr:hypothetical protein FXO37_32563 [Capsicum annuum]